MSGIRVTGTFKRGTYGTGAYAINKADALVIPIQIAATQTDRDDLPQYLRMPYMLCYVIDQNKTYRLGNDITQNNWTLETEEFVPLTQKGSPSGVAPLNADGKIPVQYLDSLYLSSTYVAVDIAEMLGFATYRGNLVVVQDASADPNVTSGSATYVKLNNTTVGATLADYLKLEFGASVVSVNGQTGAVNLEFDDIINVSAASLQQFTDLVNANATVTGNVTNILALQSDVSILQTNKADIADVLEKGNTTEFTPTGDYNPATKKYVDDAIATSSVTPAGTEGSVQVNIGGSLAGFANFLYLSDVLTVPNLKLASPTPDNSVDFVLVRDATTGLIKVREATSIGSGSGHIIQDEGIPVNNRTNLNFKGNLVSLTDDSGNDRTDVNIADPEFGDIGGAVQDNSALQAELNAKADDADLTAHTDLVEEHIDWTSPGVQKVDQSRLPAGTFADAHFTHHQQATLSTWTITHSLGKFPSVMTTREDGVEIIGDVDHLDNNTTQISFKLALKGYAYFN